MRVTVVGLRLGAWQVFGGIVAALSGRWGSFFGVLRFCRVLRCALLAAWHCCWWGLFFVTRGCRIGA